MITGVTSAYVSVVDADDRLRTGRERTLEIPRLEDRLRELLTHAYLSSEAGDTVTYFIAGDDQLQESSGPATTLVFTTANTSIPSGLISDSETDFETLNEEHGPQGGLEEVGLSTTPVGEAPTTDGFFIREQRPSDGDPTQGGYEKSFSALITKAEFEFFDGTNWLPSWDTRTMTTKRLPAAIRLTYQVTDDQNDRIMVVRLPLSDVTPTKPVTEEAAQ
jgi:hypothetical protein